MRASADAGNDADIHLERHTMIDIAFAVCCSVLVSVLLKLAPRRQLDVGQMVAANYVAASALTWALLRTAAAPAPTTALPWPELVALGVLLPTIFLVLGASVRHAGIVRSDVAQRLSLLASLIAAFTLFGQQATSRLWLGIALGVVALLALLWRGAGQGARGGRGAWLYPLLVFAGLGAIDILLKRVAAAGLPLGLSLQWVFALSFVVAALIAVVQRRSVTSPAWRNIAAGFLLGALNFGNILFYLRAHRALADDPARVFTAMNLGVVALGALVGVGLFRERLSRVNIAGLALTVPAIVLLAAR
jgi:drug/metabolite transporter (DMT)-like permease